MMSKPSAALFAAQGEKYLGSPYAIRDCQQLVEDMLADVGVKKNWLGSNAMARDMAWIGTPEECLKTFGVIPKGAFLYCWADDGGEKKRGYTDGLGNYSHVGAKTGEGKGAIASSSTKGCVAESAFADKTIPNGGWNRVGFCKLLDYGEAIEAMLQGKTPGVPASDDTGGMLYYAVAVTQTSKTVNIRATPGGKVVGSIPRGNMVEVLEDQGGDWLRVRYGGVVGYASSAYLDALADWLHNENEQSQAATGRIVIEDDAGNVFVPDGGFRVIVDSKD